MAMAATAAAKRQVAIATPAILRQRLATGFVSAVALGGCDPISPIHCSSDAKSCADCQRWSGSLARQILTTRARAGEIVGFNSEIRGGSTCMMAAIMLDWLRPSNALRLVSIS